MKTILTILSLIFSTALFAQDVPEKYQKLWEMVGEGESEMVNKKLSKELKKNPNDPWLNWMMGVSCTFTEEEKAKSYYKKAIAIDSTIGPAYYNLATTLNDSTEIDQKIELYGKAIKFDPKNGFSLVYRGELYLKQGHYELAMKDAENAKKCELIDLILIDGLIIQILDAQGKTEELKYFVDKGKYADTYPIWNSDIDYILIRVYEELNQPENVCKICKLLKKEYSMFDQDPPAPILEKLKNCP